MRPLISFAAMVVVCAAVLGAACSDEEEAPAKTASPSPTHALTDAPTPEPPQTASPAPTSVGTAPVGFDAFREFAQQVEFAVIARDANFFADRGTEIAVTCRGDEQVGQCTGQPAGMVFTGIPVQAWQTDAFGVQPREQFAAGLTDWFELATNDSMDAFGAGGLRLYALAHDEDSDDFLAIITLIGKGPPFSSGEQRQARVFYFADPAGAATLEGGTLAPLAATSGGWLLGNCAECYDYWEPWTD